MLLRRFLPVCLLAGLAASAASAQNLPVADAGDDQTLDCATPAGVEVMLDGAGSSDLDGDPLLFTWTGDALAQPVDGATPTVVLLPGVHVLTLTVDDAADGTDTDEVTITVIADETPPDLVLVDDEDELWPPNHKVFEYETDDLVESVSDDCSDLSEDDVVFALGTSDEDDEGTGDGNFPNDIVFRDHCTEAHLRAERAGNGDGRVYELVLRVADAAGNEAEETFTVSVPHDRAHDAEDSGDEHEIECESPSCPPEPDPSCSEADAAEASLAEGRKGAALRWRASGFDTAGLSDGDGALCVYTDGELAGGSRRPDKVKLKSKGGKSSLDVGTRGSDLRVPPLPLAPGTQLRLELHDGDGDCVAGQPELD
jgi:hypothetical protein